MGDLVFSFGVSLQVMSNYPLPPFASSPQTKFPALFSHPRVVFPILFWCGVSLPQPRVLDASAWLSGASFWIPFIYDSFRKLDPFPEFSFGWQPVIALDC